MAKRAYWKGRERQVEEHDPIEAIGAVLYRWDGNSLAVSYRFPDGSRMARRIDERDWRVISGLAGTGSVKFVNDDARALAEKLRRPILHRRAS
jgi:hypothetical protein